MRAVRNRIRRLATRFAPTREFLRNLAIVVIALWSLSLFFSCSHASILCGTSTLARRSPRAVHHHRLRSAAFQEGNTVVVVR